MPLRGDGFKLAVVAFARFGTLSTVRQLLANEPNTISTG
mgnify:CR=1 FL=1